MTLTPREREVLLYLAHGQSNREIADVLFISPSTVRRHLENIRLKYDLRDVRQLIVFACRQLWGRE